MKFFVDTADIGQKINKKKIRALLINTRNANALTGINGFKALESPEFCI